MILYGYFVSQAMVAQGADTFMRTKFKAMAGPDGGDGGRGGHLILRGNAQLWTLLHLRWYKNVKAENGENGSGDNCTGAMGKDIVIEVPLGTIVRDEETGEVDAEILHDGEEVIFMPGGQGGRGNAYFKTATNQAPEHAQPGEPGQEGWKILELKVLADVGLVGFPNAGKSTLLSSITAATPKLPTTPLPPSPLNWAWWSIGMISRSVWPTFPGSLKAPTKAKDWGTASSVTLNGMPCCSL